ncbi:MAG: peptidase [Bradyrhizobium sp.]|nr:peptidase [Bradyrhizobium sp.]
MRVFICADIEGVAGVASRDEIVVGGVDWQSARTRMTLETLAAIEGARAAGATGFVVADSHGTATNLIPEMLPDDVELVRAWPRRLMMMEGVDHGDFACALLLGHHAGVSRVGGMAHSFAGRLFASLTLNGRDLPECALNAAIAGQYGVPTTMISGDDACIEEAREWLGTIETVITKRSLGLFAEAGASPALIQARIRTAAERAVTASAQTEPFVLKGPLTVDMGFKSPLMPEVLAYLPLFERTGSHAARFEATDAAEVATRLQFLLMVLPSLAP